MTPEMISGLVALAGVALGGAIGFYSSLYTNKRVQVEMASNDLRNCFLPVIMKINTSGFASETELRNFAVDRFEQHALAIEAFRFYVPPQKKRIGDAEGRELAEQACRFVHLTHRQ